MNGCWFAEHSRNRDKVNAILAKQSALEKKLIEQEEKQVQP